MILGAMLSGVLCPWLNRNDILTFVVVSGGVVEDFVVCVVMLERLICTVLIVVIVGVEGVDTVLVVPLGEVTGVELGVASIVETRLLAAVVLDVGAAPVVVVMVCIVVDLTIGVVS